MAKKVAPSKKSAVTNCEKYGMCPEKFKEMIDFNDKVLGAAFFFAGKCVGPYIQHDKFNSNGGLFPRKVNGEFVYVSKDAPEVAKCAAEYMVLIEKLVMATEAEDVIIAKEIGIYLGLKAVDIMVAIETKGAKRLSSVLRKYDSLIHGSSKGGKKEPVWGPVAEKARELFAGYKRSGRVSDTDAIKRTKGELVRLQRVGELRCVVPGLTCLREHLVKKPSSRK
jgi:hypothetical protein